MSEDLGFSQDPQHHLRRMDHVWVDEPIYFITTDTANRAPILNRSECAEVLISEWKSAGQRHGWGIGLYVIMPDHVHFFAAIR